MRCLLFLLLLLAPGLSAAASSNIAASSRDAVSLVSATNTASNGTITLGLRFRLAPGWHIYWSDPGDAGFPPRIALDAPATAGAFDYPPPQMLVDGPVAAYVLSGDVLLPFTATGVGRSVSGVAVWLVCKDVCVPEHARLTLALNGGSSAEAGLFAGPKIVASPFAAKIAPDGRLSISGLGPAQVATARFFPDLQDVNRADQVPQFGPAGMTLKLKPAVGFDPAETLTGVLEITDPSGAMQALAISAAPGRIAAGPAGGSTPLIVWLGLAFLGGLILNLMPCVFPVLAMKALTLTRFGGAGSGKIRVEALGYTAGVLTAMLALGASLISLRDLGGDFGWGFQFQSPVFVVLVAWLILAVGLNLAGLFEISLHSRFARQLAHRGSFFTGLLAVVTATPCTAPFMGGAIAAALAAPLPAAFGIFLCLGVGLAAPFLLFALIPALARALPRPGHWMIKLQRILSLPMFATFLWLGWVTMREAGNLGLLLFALSAAILTLALAVKPLRPAAILALLTLPFLHATRAAPNPSLANAEPYTAGRLAELRAAGTPTFIDLTAAWCVTCLVNERATLASAAVQSGFAQNHVQTLVGDWTNRDPEITRLLQANNRDGVPLYLYYPAKAAPMLLPQILTPQIVLDAIRR
jgi:cytochrome c biogenesis protein CcdA